MENEFKYKLEVEGKDYGKNEGNNGEYVTHIPFKETNLFMSINEAMDALILKDIRSFEQMFETSEHKKYHEIASIHSLETEALLLQVIRISFEDSPDASPTAGIYFSFEDWPIADFEERTRFEFEGFRDYDPESPFLLLGSYSYESNSGFNIDVDEAITDWEHRLNYYEQERGFDDDWKYKVEIVEDTIEGSTFQDIKNYHFHELSLAFRQLLKTNINGLDKDLAIISKKNGWISGAKLSGRDKRPIAELLAIKNPDTGENVPEPGIHLKCHSPVGQLEQEAEIDLSSLGNYNDSDEHLLLANYFVEPGYRNDDYSRYTDLIPYDGFLTLLLNMDQKQQHNIGEQIQSSYTLRLTWEKVQNAAAKVDLLSDEVIQEQSNYDVEKGIENLLSLEERLFDQDTASGLPYPFYLRKAELIDNLKDVVVLSKYQKVNEAGKGMYMSFDNNQGALQLLVMLDSAFKKQQVENKADLAEKTGEVQRKRIRSERNVPPPGTQGPRL